MNKSYGYTGKGVAIYPNNDSYEGHFVNGVSLHLIIFLTVQNLEYRSVKVKRELISISQSPTRKASLQRINTLELGGTTSRTELAR